jgi:antitoxin CptB
MTDDMDMRRRRAAYRAAHRGTKEMDFILGRYAEAHLPGMTSADLDNFERLLAIPDPVLTEWFSKGVSPDQSAFETLVTALRVYHGLAALAAEGLSKE